MADRIVHCAFLKKDLPGLDRPPFRNELGQRIYNEISKEAWQQWLKDSVKFINTYRVDLASQEGQTFMAKQCAVYLGFEKGEVAQTAWTPTAGPDKGGDTGHDHAGHDHDHAGHDAGHDQAGHGHDDK